MKSFLGSLAKYGLIFFNFICLIFGLLCIIFGALARSSSNYERILNVGPGPANMSIFIGVVVFAICFLGCCGAIKENRCMLLTFGSVVLVLVVIEFTVGILAYKYRDQLADFSNDSLNKVMLQYGKNDQISQSIDDLQKNLQCCGADGPDDWLNLNRTIGAPSSCCQNAGCDPQDQSKLYGRGCIDAIKQVLAPAMKDLAVTVFVFGAFQFLGIVGSCCVASCIKRTQYDHV